ncbi:diacylglycerol kinase 1 [Prunus yedoensis var. nudiflora]|uniref:Diacylglycerol kinase 1 n=1 Tax=Prunus yedoensis var. nudiflora TaxID=2094558 RepID=A0A314V0D1_PRUYE|nr:diacylglycerol kinase 1 [Prunus yedoensis var. nudiflora]
MIPSQTLGPMTASDSFSPRCSICGAAAHLSCSSSAHKDCKCVCVMGYEHVMHQWAVRWNESHVVGLFLVDPQYCAACGVKNLVHVDCHSCRSNETGDIYDLGPFRRLILSPSPLYVKELSQASAGEFLSSITQGANEIASSVRATIRSPSKKSKHMEMKPLLTREIVVVLGICPQKAQLILIKLLMVLMKLRKTVFELSSTQGPGGEAAPIAKVYELSRYQWAAEEPLGHAAAIITDVLENAETNHVISAVQKQALVQEMALRLT